MTPGPNEPVPAYGIGLMLPYLRMELIWLQLAVTMIALRGLMWDIYTPPQIVASPGPSEPVPDRAGGLG